MTAHRVQGRDDISFIMIDYKHFLFNRRVRKVPIAIWITQSVKYQYFSFATFAQYLASFAVTRDFPASQLATGGKN
jgi:hypothetical protein